MKALYDFTPSGPSDTVAITCSPAAETGYPLTNLKNIKPALIWKASDSNQQLIHFDFGATTPFDTIFLNNINFQYVEVLGSNTASTVGHGDWASPPFGIDYGPPLPVLDELSDETSAKLWLTLAGPGAFNYRYARLKIYAHASLALLFNETRARIGNILWGNAVQLWSPKPGYSVNINANGETVKFDSGYQSYYRKGRSSRTFKGAFDKITRTEYDKIRKTMDPFVFYQEFDSDARSAYLVRNSAGMGGRTYEFSDYLSNEFSFEEIV